MTSDGLQRCMIPTFGGFELIDIHSIVCGSGKGKTSIVHLSTGETLHTHCSLGKLFELIGSETFAQAHRSHLVNIHQIKKYESGTITMSDGTSVPLARRRKSELIKRLKTAYKM